MLLLRRFTQTFLNGGLGRALQLPSLKIAFCDLLAMLGSHVGYLLSCCDGGPPLFGPLGQHTVVLTSLVCHLKGLLCLPSIPYSTCILHVYTTQWLVRGSSLELYATAESNTRSLLCFTAYMTGCSRIGIGAWLCHSAWLAQHEHALSSPCTTGHQICWHTWMIVLRAGLAK